MTRYQHLATLLAERIEQGLYRHGEKLPSVRSLSQEHGVSISTVQQAYQTLDLVVIWPMALCALGFRSFVALSSCSMIDQYLLIIYQKSTGSNKAFGA